MRQYTSFRRVATTLLLAGALIPLTSAARTGDRDLPLEASASYSRYSESEQTQLLRDDVVITQGSLKLTAAELLIHLDKGRATRLSASGSPVTFEQLNDAGQRVSGYADALDYHSETGRLELTGNAHLDAPNQTLDADHIIYNITSHEASASGGDSGRVNLVIQPADANQ